MSLTFLREQYSPRYAVPNSKEYLSDFRKRVPQDTFPTEKDVRYGKGPKQTLDIYTSSVYDEMTNPRQKVLLWFHGGNWQHNDKSNYHHFAKTLNDLGVTLYAVNYDLCPDVTLDEIVQQAKEAVRWSVGSLMTDLYISGHSCGAQMCAKILDDPEFKYDVKGALLISGIYNLYPYLAFPSSYSILKLDRDMAERNSAGTIVSDAKVVVCAGELEPEAWRRCTIEYAVDNNLDYFMVPKAHHYNLNKDCLADSNSSIIDSLIKIIYGG